MKPELFWLTLTATMTGLLWMPYILDRAMRRGWPKAFQTPKMGAPPVEAEWALRAKRAHENAVENLVVFAPLVIVVHLVGAGNGMTAFAAALYFWCRVGHYVVLTVGIPYLRTLIWTAGWVAQMILAYEILTHG